MKGRLPCFYHTVLAIPSVHGGRPTPPHPTQLAQDDLRHAHNVQASKGMPPPVRLPKTAQAEDAFGTPVNAMPIAPVACPSCGRRVAASRFANHLDKCLHRASR